MTSHLSEPHTHHEEQNPPQPDADPVVQHNSVASIREENEDKREKYPLWRIDFDGSCTRKKAGAGVWLHNTESDYTESHDFNRNFKCTNNIAEYEALILGLNLLKKLGAHRIAVHGDSKLIINQMNSEYIAKHPRLRAYRNYAMDLLKTFVEYELVFVPRSQNVIANGLACIASSYHKPPSDKQIIIQTKYRPAVPDNEKYWQVFEGDKKIEDFLTDRNEFELSDSDSKSNDSCMTEEPPDEEKSPHSIEINTLTEQLGNPTKEYKNVDKEEIEVLQSKDKNITRGLAPLEDLFDFDDIAKKPTTENSDSNVEE